jgi:hypothetical protein
MEMLKEYLNKFFLTLCGIKNKRLLRNTMNK